MIEQLYFQVHKVIKPMRIQYIQYMLAHYNSMNNLSECKWLKYNANYRPPDKSAYWKTIFFTSHPKNMLWVLKTNVYYDG